MQLISRLNNSKRGSSAPDQVLVLLITNEATKKTQYAEMRISKTVRGDRSLSVDRSSEYIVKSLYPFIYDSDTGSSFTIIVHKCDDPASLHRHERGRSIIDGLPMMMMNHATSADDLSRPLVAATKLLRSLGPLFQYLRDTSYIINN